MGCLSGVAGNLGGPVGPEVCVDGWGRMARWARQAAVFARQSWAIICGEAGPARQALQVDWADGGDCGRALGAGHPLLPPTMQRVIHLPAHQQHVPPCGACHGAQHAANCTHQHAASCAHHGVEGVAKSGRCVRTRPTLATLEPSSGPRPCPTLAVPMPLSRLIARSSDPAPMPYPSCAHALVMPWA